MRAVYRRVMRQSSRLATVSEEMSLMHSFSVSFWFWRNARARYARDGIVPCTPGGLSQHYRGRTGKPNGNMDSNLVGECDNVDVPDHDFSTCENNTYMCCWTENDGQGMQDNTVHTVGLRGFACPSLFSRVCDRDNPT